MKRETDALEESLIFKAFSEKPEDFFLYLVDSTSSVLPTGAAAGLHHIADVFSGSQQLGHVHCGLWPQRVSLRLVGPRHAVQLHLTNHRHTYDKDSF